MTTLSISFGRNYNPNSDTDFYSASDASASIYVGPFNQSSVYGNVLDPPSDDAIVYHNIGAVSLTGFNIANRDLAMSDGGYLFDASDNTNKVTFIGGTFGDVLRAGSGNDSLRGENGDDWLEGGAGNDALHGGAGVDTFAFAGPGSGDDTVADFAHGSDKIRLDASYGLTAAQALANASDDGNGNTVVDLGNGDSITLTGVLASTLDDADFIGVNVAPTATITPPSYNATEQTDLSLKGTLSVGDEDGRTGSQTITLSVTEGTLTVEPGTSGATVENSGTSSVTIRGTIAQLNALLSTDGTSAVVYNNGSDTPSASVTLTLSIADNGSTGTDGSKSGSDTATIAVAAVNDSPIATDDAAALLQRETVSGNVLTDPVADSDPDLVTLAIDTIAFDGTSQAVAAGGTAIDGRRGTLTIAADGSYSYEADVERGLAVGATITDIFQYTVSDDQGDSDTGQLTITVTGSGIGDDGANFFRLTDAGKIATGLGGNDSYIVDDASDQAIEAVGGGIDVVRARSDYKLAAGTEIEFLKLGEVTGAASFDLTGNEFDNTVIGNKGANRLDGGGGSDKLLGGRGNDTYIVDDLRDVVLEGSRDGGNDTVRASANFRLSENIETLVLTGSRNIAGTGNASNNTIIGNSGDNTLAGGLGADTLSGNGGRDRFLFDKVLGDGNVDHITSFSLSDDKIVLDLSIFRRLERGGLDADAFKDITSGAAVDSTDRILYDHDSGRLFYDANGSGAGARTLVAILDNDPSLTFRDFLVV